MPKKFSKPFKLVLDVGTTGVKAFVFDRDNRLVAKVYRKLNKNFPKPGWVEQDPGELVRKSRIVLRQAVRIGKTKDFIGFGLTNQRETTILWNKRTGRPVYPAIVWEDRRTKKFCSDLNRKAGRSVRQKTGLPIDSYFSASKIRWLFDNVPAAKKLAAEGNLAFGTVDSWILGNFLENAPHLIDYTNASRTLLFNIRKLKWDAALLRIFDLPANILPAALPSQAFFGSLKKEILGFSLPALAVCGDQQASMAAAGLKKGKTKVTYGTGIFIMHSLDRRFIVREPFFTTSIPGRSNPSFALEAKIANCGPAVEKVLKHPEKMRALVVRLAKKVDVYLKQLPSRPKEIVIDGGVTQYKFLALIQWGISKIPVQKQKIYDGTALGIAILMDKEKGRLRKS